MPVRMMVLAPAAALLPKEDRPKQHQQRDQADRAEDNETFAGGRISDPP